MCGRMNHGKLTWAQLRDWLALGLPPGLEEIPQRFNVAPTLMVPVAWRGGEGGSLTAGLARWGLVPGWYREPVKAWRAATFNARAEDVASKPAFRTAYGKGRCLVLASGYYEWQVGEGGKQPWYIHPSGNAPALVFAGLMTSVRLPDYEGLTCTILTEAAPPELAFMHDRVPVMLGEAGQRDWLGGAGIEEVPRIGVESLAWHRVGHAVGAVRNEGPELIEPVD